MKILRTIILINIYLGSYIFGLSLADPEETGFSSPNGHKVIRSVPKKNTNLSTYYLYILDDEANEYKLISTFEAGLHYSDIYLSEHHDLFISVSSYYETFIRVFDYSGKEIKQWDYFDLYSIEERNKNGSKASTFENIDSVIWANEDELVFRPAQTLESAEMDLDNLVLNLKTMSLKRAKCDYDELLPKDSMKMNYKLIIAVLISIIAALLIHSYRLTKGVNSYKSRGW